MKKAVKRVPSKLACNWPNVSFLSKWKIACYSAISLSLFIVSACLLTMSSCSSTRIVTVPEYHEVVVHQRDTTSLRDSIFVHDSICIEQRGDTVRIVENHILYRDRWRDRLRVDSFIRRDTVTVVKEVEKPPNAWQRIRLGFADVAFLLFVVAFCVYGVRLALERSK